MKKRQKSSKKNYGANCFPTKMLRGQIPESDDLKKTGVKVIFVVRWPTTAKMTGPQYFSNGTILALIDFD